MPLSAADSSDLRGAIAIVDGLALWLLALVLAAYAPGDGGIRTEGGILAPIVATMRGWWATPGVGAFELLGYAGLAIAAAGVAYLVASRSPVRELLADLREGNHTIGLLNRRSDDGSPPSLDPVPSIEGDDEAGFVFDAARTRRTARSLAVGGGGLQRGSSSTDWAEELLSSATTSAGPSDFLRGGSSAMTDAAPEAPAMSVGASADDEPTPADPARGPNLLAAEAASDGGRTGSGHLDEGVLEAFEARGSTTRDDESTDATRTGETEDGDATGATGDEPTPTTVDPAVRVAAAVDEARGKLDRLENRLSMAAADRSADRASDAVTSIVDEATELEAARSVLAPRPGVDVGAAIGDLRHDQRRLEDGIAAAFSGS